MTINFIKKTNQAGTTLIEIIVVMGLLAIMLMLVATLFTSAADSQAQSQMYSATASDGRYIIARLDHDIARASSVSTPGSFGGNSSQLVLVIGGSNYTYSLSNDDLALTDPSGSDDLNSSGTTVSNLSFSKIGVSGQTTTIKYSFTLTSTAQNRGTKDSQTFTSAAGLAP